ncbi:MAG: S8 family peptidase [Chloroflexota bacterium]
MQWTFQMGGKDVTFTSVESAVAVRPTEAARAQAGTRGRLTGMFGSAATDTSNGGRFGLDLPSRNRQIFERAGWVFVEPTLAVADAASVTRRTTEYAESVQPVFVDRSGNMQIGTDLLTVQLAPDIEEAEAERRLAAANLRIVRRIAFAPNMYEVQTDTERPLPELVAELQASSDFVTAEPMLLQTITGRLKPTDPHYAEQWQHANTGSNGGVAGADIASEQAWALTRGRGAQRAVRIAVIDNGMQVNHPDLKPGVVGGGYFKSNGVGSATLVPYRPGVTGFPTGNHGTFCMGMAGGRMNNNRGGCGSAPEADMLAIACLPDQIGTQATLARAVAYAVDPSREIPALAASAGADVIVCSLGPNGADWDITSVMDLAIRFAATQGREGKGTPVFWAVSNGHFPVAHDEVSSHPDVIAVGRSSRRDKADGSAFGPELAFLAPGADVYSTYASSRYGIGTGTSYAAPLAAGVGALVLAKHPNLTARQVRERMEQSCIQIGGVTYQGNRHPEYGFGRINALKAIQ